AHGLGQMHAVPLEAGGPHEACQQRHRLHHGEAAADAGAWTEAERHELGARMGGLALGSETLRVEAGWILPKRLVPVHGKNGKDAVMSRSMAAMLPAGRARQRAICCAAAAVMAGTKWARSAGRKSGAAVRRCQRQLAPSEVRMPSPRVCLNTRFSSA